MDELNRFLIIDEEPPTYQTKSRRVKKRDSVIGILHGSKNTLTGIIDIAMIGSLYSKGKESELFRSYGQVIMDECHHAASNTAVEVLKKVNARYVYGVSATPKRGDSLEKITYMLLGPIRHSYTAKERAVEQGIDHFVYPRYTRVIDTNESKNDINGSFDYPRLDTLMLAAPVSFAGRLEQYIGRLNRDYEGKTEVIVYDYIDSHIRYFDNMYAKRLRTYKRIGFEYGRKYEA